MSEMQSCSWVLPRYESTFFPLSRGYPNSVWPGKGEYSVSLDLWMHITCRLKI